MMRRRNTGTMNYNSDAYKDYKEYLRRSNPTLPSVDNAPRGEQEGKHNPKGASPPLGFASAPGNSYPNYNNNIVNDPRQNEATQGKKHATEKRNKKVEFADKVVKIEQNTSPEQVYEVKSIDMEASDFINKKRRLFEMARWASLRAF